VLEFPRDVKMFKRFALIIVIVISALGIVFVCLDIFDIDEDFRIHLPTAIINTAFFLAVVVPVGYMAARNFMITGSRQMLWLGCGALAYGVGSLFREWLVGKGLTVPITIYNSVALIASVAHLIGASLSIAKMRIPNPELKRQPRIVLFYYLGILVSISLVTLLIFRGLIPPLYVPDESSSVQIKDIVRGVATIFFLASSLIYIRLYYKSRTDFLYFYSLGLTLFAFCLISLSLGAADTRISWLGRVSQYAGSIYFLIAVLCAYRQASGRKVGTNPP
jgi:hypothetical protein